MFPGFTPGECNGLNTASSETFLFFQGLQFTLDRQLKGGGGGGIPATELWKDGGNCHYAVGDLRFYCRLMG